MVKLIEDRDAVLFLSNALAAKGITFPPEATERNIHRYQSKARDFLIRKGRLAEEIDTFFTQTLERYRQRTPTENELNWFMDDPRASFWLMCKLDHADDINSLSDLIVTGNSLLDELGTKKNDTPPNHNLRVDYIKDKIRNQGGILTPREYLRDLNNEWEGNLGFRDIFKDVNSPSGVSIDWLIGYLKDNNITLANYQCGSIIEEKLAYCYASYFIWCEQNRHDGVIETNFKNKFKSAFSTQKARAKKNASRAKQLNVHIAEEFYDKMRDIAISEGISNARVIEHAIQFAWHNKKHPRYK
ncbi:hypothetical protein Dd586_2890 [Dickeya parazeae Ech586]|uniref:Uncharacterized protein n=1 Tax=Dickeya zeae (strain Ech586) TaxID=590409 RepID=D2BSW2_DICZ5|nr:hypothetical protein [Dickeya parazeae]ACZ77725.1 hypothetical protein Dd586_2890 [Dickeya parazeae Ech586]